MVKKNKKKLNIMQDVGIVLNALLSVIGFVIIMFVSEIAMHLNYPFVAFGFFATGIIAMNFFIKHNYEVMK